MEELQYKVLRYVYSMTKLKTDAINIRLMVYRATSRYSNLNQIFT